MGGSGGATNGGGGAGAGMVSPCPTDCSQISTGQCLVAICNEELLQCEVIADEDGTTCDDGLFCTANDFCSAGVCMGGAMNTCGMNPPECNEVICNEASQSCSTAPAMDGATCMQDMCLVGSQCSNGSCVGGVPNDCFFAHVPNDCHIAVCDPQTGMCVPEPGNENDACTDQNDLCSINNTCTGGVCSGGTPRDCSGLTMGCFDGVCNQMTGQCEQMAIMPGQMCAEATDECNDGICDMMGNCNPMPANQGQACDTDGCFVGQTCNVGTCQGGAEITACINNDDCCPATCDLTNDDDCGCDFALISNETQLQDAVITNLIIANGHTFINYDNNQNGVHSSNMTLLNMYETIIFHEHDRTISSVEMNNLTAWVQAGGRLLVTGYDSLGSPTDQNLANVVNCTGPGDGPFSNTLIVTNATHPIMMGPAQAFMMSQSLTASTTDHDQCNPGVNAVRLISVTSSSKLQVTDNVGAGNGKVIYWNGNGVTTGPLTDWNGTGGSQPDLQNLFVNVLDHMCQ